MLIRQFENVVRLANPLINRKYTIDCKYQFINKINFKCFSWFNVKKDILKEQEDNKS